MRIDLIAFVLPYLLIFARISSTLTIAPGFSDTHIPVRYRLLFALALSLTLKDVLPPYSILSAPMDSEKINSLPLIMLLIQETLIGTFIGFISRLLLNILDIIGNIVSLQTGLGNATVFNPTMAAQTPVLDHFVIVAGIMLFFTMDVHHLVIKSIIHSYIHFPVHPVHLEQGLFSSLLRPLENLSLFFMQSFKIACQLSLPFLILGLLFQFMLGLLNRVVPSIQIFFIALPLQILLGFILLMIVLPLVLHLSLTNFSQLYNQFFPGMSA